MKGTKLHYFGKVQKLRIIEMPSAKSAYDDTLCLIVAGHEIICSPNIFFLDSNLACPFFKVNCTCSPVKTMGITLHPHFKKKIGDERDICLKKDCIAADQKGVDHIQYLCSN